jgi:hypothetical protein
MHIFVVNFNEGALDEMLLVLLAVDHCDDLIEAARNDSLQTIHVLAYLSLMISLIHFNIRKFLLDSLPLEILFPAHDGVRLATASLTVGEDRPIISF